MLIRMKDFWVGLIFLSLGLLLVFYLIPFGIDEPKKVKFAVMSPSYFPRIVGIAMIGIGVAIAIGAATSSKPAEWPGEFDAGAFMKVALIFGVFLSTAYALPQAGFVLTCSVVLALLMLIAGERNPITVTAVALITPITLHLFFTKIANVPIPGGVLEPHLRGL